MSLRVQQQQQQQQPQGSRKRRKISSNNNKPRRRLQNKLPLEGTVICLTGFSSEEKDRLHSLIQKLGGVFTRDLNSTKNTHLIASVVQGPKCEAALSLEHIDILPPAWLEACSQQSRRVDEAPYSLKSTTSTTTTAAPLDVHPPSSQDTETETRKSTRTGREETLLEALEKTLLHTSNDTDDAFFLFSSCQFYLLGFDSDKDEDDGSLLLMLLGRLIRRGMGTILWELQKDVVSHIIVKDGFADQALVRDVVRTFETPPRVVSPWWVMESWKRCQLARCSLFAPRYGRPKQKQSSSTTTTNTKTSRSTKRAPSIFRGCLFATIRVAPPPDRAAAVVDFDATQIEQTAVAHGGQLLSLKLVQALQADQDAAAAATGGQQQHPQPSQQRCCYVVCWGHFQLDNLIHPLVTAVMRRQLCQVEFVTPLWLRTCTAEQQCLTPSQTAALPQVFCPVSTSATHNLLYAALAGTSSDDDDDDDQKKGRRKKNTKRGSSSDEKEKTASAAAVRVSVTGFTGFKRTALVQLIQAMGGVYDDSMRTSTTHLVCHKPAGEKYHKAKEWKIHVVSEDWLYHVASYGFGGQQQKNNKNGSTTSTVASADHGRRQGCENRFTVK